MTRYLIKATESERRFLQPDEPAAGSSPWGSGLDAYFDVAAGWTSLPCGKRRRSLSGTGWPCARHTCDVTTDKRVEIGIAQSSEDGCSSGIIEASIRPFEGQIGCRLPMVLCEISL